MKSISNNIFTFGSFEHTENSSTLSVSKLLSWNCSSQILHDEHGEFSGIKAIHLGYFDAIDTYESETVGSFSVPSAKKLALASLSDMICSKITNDALAVLFSTYLEAELGFTSFKSLQNNCFGVIYTNRRNGKFRLAVLFNYGKIIAFAMLC